MSTENWRKYSVERFMAAIEGSGGNITLVCNRVGCKRETFIKAMNEHQELRDALNSAEEEFGDLVESKIAKHIKEGNVTMTIFYAKTKLKKRGYIEAAIIHEGEKVPMVVDDIPQTVQQPVKPVAPVDPEQEADEHSSTGGQ